MLNVKLMATYIFFFLLASSAWAERPWPETQYDCQVTTTSGAKGFVTIQAHSLEQARKSALDKRVPTTQGSAETSVSVVECIPHGEGKFKDSAFEDWQKRMVR